MRTGPKWRRKWLPRKPNQTESNKNIPARKQSRRDGSPQEEYSLPWSDGSQGRRGTFREKRRIDHESPTRFNASAALMMGMPSKKLVSMTSFTRPLLGSDRLHLSLDFLKCHRFARLGVDAIKDLAK